MSSHTIQAATETDKHADTVTLPASGDVDADEVKLTVSAELMKNQKRAAPIDVTETIEVVQNSDGDPLIFSIGTNDDFELIRHDSATATGYEAVDLIDGFSGYDGAADFDVTQDRKGNISVAVASSRDGDSGTDVFIASDLSNDASKANWAKFHEKCAKVSGIDSSFVARNVTMGTTDDGEPAFVVVEGTLDGQEYYYQVDHDGSATKLELPENVDPGDVEDLSIGYAFGQRGKYFLYDQGKSQTLTCITIGDEFEGSEHYDYSPGNEDLPKEYRDLTYNCIATPLGTETDDMTISSDVYVGARSGVYVFRNAKAANLQKVTDDLDDVHEIIVRQHDDTVVVWAMCSPNELYYVTGKRSDSGYEFDDPVLFDDSTVHLAPIRNRQKRTNELFTVTQDRTIDHHWQASESTLWQERTISVKDDEFIHDFTSFTTQISVETGDGEPLRGESLEITSSEWTYAQANGRLYSFDRDEPAEVEVDPRGQVTIVDNASDISPPVFHVTADFLEKTINVYPNGKIERGLRGIEQGSDLKKARTQDGKPVVSGSHDDSSVDGVAYNVHRLAKTAGKQMDHERDDGHTFVSVADDGTKHTGTLNAAHVPDDFSMAMSLNEGSWESTDDEAAASMVGGAKEFFGSIGGFFRHIGRALAEGIETVVKDGKEVVTHLKDGVEFLLHKAEDALYFVLKLGEKTIKYALETIGTVFKAINWVLKQIGIDLEKVLEWLGHLFGWDDIWQSHKVIASIMTSGLDYLVEQADEQIETWRAELNEAFDGLDKKIDELKVPKDIRNMRPKEKKSEAQKKVPGMNLHSPAANRPMYQIQHGGMLNGSANVSHDSDPFTTFLDDIVIPTGTDLANDLANDAQDVANMFKGAGPTVDEVLTLCADLTHTVVDPVEDVIDGSLKFVEDLLGSVKKALTDTFDVPFLSSFYEWLTGLLGESEKFTVVNAVSLIVAIPFTVVFKAVKGRAPFENGTFGLEDPDLFKTMLGDNPMEKVASTNAGDGDAAFVESISGMDAVEADEPTAESDATSVVKAFSAYAGIIGSFVTMFQVVLDMTMALIEEIPTPLQIFDAALSFAGYLLFTPVPQNFENASSFGNRIAGWGLGVVWTTVQTVFKFNEKFKSLNEGVGKQIVSGISAGIRVIRLVLYLVADGLSGADGWGWAGDITLMGGLFVTEVGGVIPDARKDIQVAVVETGFLVTLIGAAVGVIPLFSAVS